MKKEMYGALVCAVIVGFMAIGFAANAQDTNEAILLDTPVNTNSDTNVNQEALNVNATADAVVDSTVAVELPDAGILPDSQFYKLKLWWEDVRRVFTFSDVKRAELEFRLALQRAVEAQELVAKGKGELAREQLQRHERQMERFEERIQKLESASAEKTDELVNKLESIQKRHQDLLTEVYDKVPENAKEGVLNAIEQSSKGLANAIEKVQGTDEAEQFINTVQSRVENAGEEIQIQLRARIQNITNGLQGNGNSGNSNAGGNSENANQNRNQNQNQNMNQNTNQTQEQVRVQERLQVNSNSNQNAGNQ